MWLERLLRDYTLGFALCIVVSDSNKGCYNLSSFVSYSPKAVSSSFAYYLAGVLDDNGCIVTPKRERSDKNRLCYPSIQISFPSRNLPLALLIQKELGYGSIAKASGKNACNLTINDFTGVLSLVSLVNGKLRTGKADALEELIT